MAVAETPCWKPPGQAVAAFSQTSSSVSPWGGRQPLTLPEAEAEKAWLMKEKKKLPLSETPIQGNIKGVGPEHSERGGAI